MSLQTRASYYPQSKVFQNEATLSARARGGGLLHRNLVVVETAYAIQVQGSVLILEEVAISSFSKIHPYQNQQVRLMLCVSNLH